MAVKSVAAKVGENKKPDRKANGRSFAQLVLDGDDEERDDDRDDDDEEEEEQFTGEVKTEFGGMRVSEPYWQTGEEGAKYGNWWLSLSRASNPSSRACRPLMQ